MYSIYYYSRGTLLLYLSIIITNMFNTFSKVLYANKILSFSILFVITIIYFIITNTYDIA